MTDIDHEKLLRLKEQIQRGKATEFPMNLPLTDLKPNEEVDITYSGQPIRVILVPQSPENLLVLEVGRPEDLHGLGLYTREVGDLFLIVDRAVYSATEGKAGFKGLQEGEEVMIGRDNPLRFALSDAISGKHVWLKKEGDHIKIKDLGSTNGTAIQLLASNPGG